MIEVPAAALRAPGLLAEVDFVSIGTNDLAQYCFAADRELGALSELQDRWQPALLDLVAMTVSAARAAGKPCGVCGEAAADPAMACVLVGLGVTTLSMSPAVLPASPGRARRAHDGAVPVRRAGRAGGAHGGAGSRGGPCPPARGWRLLGSVKNWSSSGTGSSRHRIPWGHGWTDGNDRPPGDRSRGVRRRGRVGDASSAPGPSGARVERRAQQQPAGGAGGPGQAGAVRS